VEALERTISDPQSQLERATEIIVTKDNDLEKLARQKYKLPQADNPVKQRMSQIGATLRRAGV